MRGGRRAAQPRPSPVARSRRRRRAVAAAPLRASPEPRLARPRRRPVAVAAARLPRRRPVAAPVARAPPRQSPSPPHLPSSALLPVRCRPGRPSAWFRPSAGASMTSGRSRSCGDLLARALKRGRRASISAPKVDAADFWQEVAGGTARANGAGESRRGKGPGNRAATGGPGRGPSAARHPDRRPGL